MESCLWNFTCHITQYMGLRVSSTFRNTRKFCRSKTRLNWLWDRSMTIQVLLIPAWTAKGGRCVKALTLATGWADTFSSSLDACVDFESFWVCFSVYQGYNWSNSSQVPCCGCLTTFGLEKGWVSWKFFVLGPWTCIYLATILSSSFDRRPVDMPTK